MNKFTKLAATSLLLGAPVLAMAQDEQPVIYEIQMENGGSPYQISDNGKWVCGHAVNPNNSSLNGLATLINAETGEIIPLWNPEDDTEVCAAHDVTDDGVVVGNYHGKAAIRWFDTKEWMTLPSPEGNFIEYEAFSVTPDGEWVTGGALTSGWITKPVAWHVVDRKATLVSIPQELWDVSIEAGDPDGRFKTVLPGGLVPTVYGLYNLATGETRSFGKMGDTEYAYSPDGHWMLRHIYPEDNPEAEIPSGYELVDLHTGEVHPIEDNSYYTTVTGHAPDNKGNIFGHSEHDLMFRSTYIHVGKYWYDLRNVLLQKYGIKWNETYGHDAEGLTGTFWRVDGSGKVFTMCDYIEDSYTTYIVRMPQSFDEICPDIDLLNNFYTTPVNGAAFSVLRDVAVTFDRPISVVGGVDSAYLIDDEGNRVRNSIGFAPGSGNQNVLNITFRNFTLEENKTYTVVIPAGSVAVYGDGERTNKEIRFSYSGRPNTPVAPVTISPAPGNSVPRINATTNPAYMTFDTELSICDNPDEVARINLYIKEDDMWSHLWAMAATVEGRSVKIYTSTDQLLAQDREYRITISAGTFADLSGANPNEEINIDYIGSYTPEPPASGRVIFEDDFDIGINTATWMLYDGDNNTPSEEAAAWGFTSEYPWFWVRDTNESTDQSAATHSMYTPAGASDDWMVTPRLYISDDTYTLKFKSQSYREAANDILKVYIYESDELMTSLTSTAVSNIRYRGTLAYDKKQSPGKSEGLLAGDWTENEIPLSAYAGKNIYIAFVNENNNQSAIFLDDVEVTRELSLSLGVLTPEYAVAKNEIEIKGHSQNLTSEPIDAFTLRLLDADGNEIDRIEETQAGVNPEEIYTFTFSKPLPLKKGYENAYSIELEHNGKTSTVNASVKNLAFQTTKRVALEENTGTACGFCPQGHVVIDMLREDFGDRFIPLAYHGYSGGSRFANESAADFTTYFGLNAAPTGLVDRKVLASPLAEGYTLYDEKGGDTWYSLVAAGLESQADADICIGSEVSDDSTSATITVNMAYAFNTSNLNVNLLAVMLEDNLTASQSNNFVGSDAPIMADWEMGGKYGSNPSRAPFNDVVRSYTGTSIAGTPGYVPAAATAGELIQATIRMPIPPTIKEPLTNAKIAVLMIDANTGYVINADCRKLGEPAPEDSVESITDNEVVSSEWYNLQGMRLKEAADGLNIRIDRLSDGTVRTVKIVK